jgi:hypothetical protein
MENLTETKFITSKSEIEGLMGGTLAFSAAYAFNNPESINGPFGTILLELYVDDATQKEMCLGEIKINTLWGLGTITDLHFTGPVTFNGSTGYSTLTANAFGSFAMLPDLPQYVSTKLNITLKPGVKEGSLTVDGFLENFPIKVTKIIYNRNNH